MIAVLDYGIGNLRSAEKALQRLGADARLVTDVDEARTAAAVVLPGVGAFGPCMEALVASGLDRVALDAAGSGVPFLGICIGMQLLYDGSEESPGVAGLGIVPGVVRRLPDGVKRPQMQWNRLEISAPSALLAGPSFEGPAADPWVYFVHSYAGPVTDDIVATCDYGGPVAAVVGRERLWATQFHPEKSGATGLALLANFVAVVEGRVDASATGRGA
jgi:glutamine amidotransferase